MDMMNASPGVAASPGTDPAGAPSGTSGPAGSSGPGSVSPGVLSPGAGQLRSGTPFLPVTVNEVTPSETSGMDAPSVMGILHNLDVDGVREAASAHTALGETLDRIGTNLMAHGNTLAGSWQGDAAQAAVETFQQMHSQTTQLAAQAKQTGQVLHWTANVMEQYKNLPTPAGDASTPAPTPGGAPGAAIGDVTAAVAGIVNPAAGHQAKVNAQAQQYLNELNQHLVTANNSMPPSIGHAHSAPATGSAHGGTVTGASGGAGRSAGGQGSGPYTGTGPAPGSSVPGAGPGTGSPSGTPATTAAPLPHAPSTAALQSSAAPAPAPAAPSVPAPAAAAPGGTAVPPMVPVGPASGASGSSSASGGSLGSTTDEDDSEESSTLASAEEPEGEDSDNATIGDRKQNAASGEGSALPMMGGSGGGQSGAERQREAWINEDKNIWGLPQGDIGPEIDGQ